MLAGQSSPIRTTLVSRGGPRGAAKDRGADKPGFWLKMVGIRVSAHEVTSPVEKSEAQVVIASPSFSKYPLGDGTFG